MQKLYTVEGAFLPEIPWNIYPRPQMRRERWLSLNGTWSLSSGSSADIPIRVPFCPESLLSGISDVPPPGTELVYSREFSLPFNWAGGHTLLHFGAVSRDCRVLLNGKPVCRHENGYLSFSADITDTLQPGSNRLEVHSVNDLSPAYPWGKQSRKPGGMWYTPVSGIWQSVWLEPVPSEYIRSLSITTGLTSADISVAGADSGTVYFENREIPFKGGRIHLEPACPLLWSPESPHLYTFRICSGEDEVTSYFALRTLSVEECSGIPRLCLNGRPYFFNGLLDQGYWSDGLYTPAVPEAFEKDILAMKKLGYNTLRKHVKIEPEQFYYDCDRLGMIVFQDMVNCGSYRFLRDTGLPTLGFQRRSDRRMKPGHKVRENFLSSMEGTVLQLQNHPCICLWTIFNEGWGQFCSDELYRNLKALDPSRFIDSTSGWFHQKHSDVESLHIYFDKLHLGKQHRPQLLSEFGGFSYKLPTHSYNLEKTYGYRKYTDKASFVRDFRALYEELVPLVSAGLCGAIYTQVSDVEEETNGIFTFDRKVLKLESSDVSDLFSALSIPCPLP